VQIAIDGPAASGKSTAAKILAKKLDFLYIDTGAMYRAVTLEGLKRKINFENDQEITKTAGEIEIKIEQDWSTDRGFRVYLSDEDITEKLFIPEVDKLVSTVARVPEVRKIMVHAQQKLAMGNNVVMSGRDIGSNVLINADLKIYLTAEADVRAERRLKELEQKGIKGDYQEILENIRHRDKIDSGRADNPLVKTADAVEVDCSNLTIDEMVNVIEQKARPIMTKN
jgi:CMP/dCMP kinase